MFLHQLPTYLVLTHLCIMLLDIDTGPYLRVSASTFVSNKYSGSNNYFAICEFQLSHIANISLQMFSCYVSNSSH